MCTTKYSLIKIKVNKYLGHVDDALRKGLVTKHRAILISLTPLQQYEEFVSVALQEVRILECKLELEFSVEQPIRRHSYLIRAQRPLGALHLDRDANRRQVRAQWTQDHEPR